MRSKAFLRSGFFQRPPGWLGRAVKAVALGMLCLTCQRVSAADPYEMGLRLYAQGEYAAAAPYFIQAGRATENPNAHYYLADCYLKLNRPADTQAEYLKIIAMAPNSQAARFSRLGLARLSAPEAGDSIERPWRSEDLSISDSPDRYQGEPPVGADYLDEVMEGGQMVRWSLRKMPLKLYVEETPQGIRNFQPAFAAQVRRALNVWSGVLNHQLSYESVRDPERADIRVSWTNTIDTRGHGGDGHTAYTAGLMIPHIRSDRIEYMEIQIATFDILGKPQNSDTIYAVAIHELGHSLGLLGHSDDPHDLMYGENQHITAPSRRDMNTLRRLYSAAADIDNLPAASRAKNPNREAELTAALDKSVSEMEARAQRDNMALSYLNLGVVYFQKAKQVSAKGGNSQEWYEKAWNATDRAIRMEPRDSRAYHKRSLIEQELGRFPDALSSIQTAISLSPREPEYYLLQAWFLARLDRKAEARGALDTYLLFKPGDAGAADVRRVREALSSHSSKP